MTCTVKKISPESIIKALPEEDVEDNMANNEEEGNEDVGNDASGDDKSEDDGFFFWFSTVFLVFFLLHL